MVLHVCFVTCISCLNETQHWTTVQTTGFQCYKFNPADRISRGPFDQLRVTLRLDPAIASPVLRNDLHVEIYVPQPGKQISYQDHRKGFF